MKKIIFWTIIIVVAAFVFTPAKTILMNKNQKDIQTLKKCEKQIKKVKSEDDAEVWYNLVQKILDTTDSEKVEDKAYNVLDVYRNKIKTINEDIQELRNMTVYNLAKENIFLKLKSPSTAKFQPSLEIKSEYKDGFYYMSLWVDAQNSFGATVRENYIVKYKADGDNIAIVDIYK